MAGHDEPLLISTRYVEGMVNFQGEKIKHNSEFGGWKSATRVITFGSIESFIHFGMASNLISYLTIQLEQSTATAAMNVNAWSGFTNMIPLLTSFVADSYLGRFRTILFSSLIYVLAMFRGLVSINGAQLPVHIVVPLTLMALCELDHMAFYKGLGLLTLSTSLQSASSSSCSSPSTSQVFFFSSLYLIGFGSAVCTTCAPAFGADQFDELNPGESKSKSSFFNWWLIGFCAGSSSSHLILNYVQDNLGWGLAFGISCISMVAAATVFSAGAKSYRYSSKTHVDKHTPSEEINDTPSGVAKVVPSLVPLCIICLMYTIVDVQNVTLFTKQGSTMDRSIGKDFQIPAAAIQSLIGLSVILFTALYDRAFVPFARALTGKPNGITTLQRIGGGIVISAISMVVAAAVENTRLRIALEFGSIDGKATVPMAIWWLIPQYVLCGLAIVFTRVGLQEFFYDQVPNELRSVGLSLYSTVSGVGSILSGFIIVGIQKATSAGGRYGWFANNINQGHLDYYGNIDHEYHWDHRSNRER